MKYSALICLLLLIGCSNNKVEKGYYENGQLRYLCNTYKDVLNGECKFFYSNGNPMLIGEYNEGLKVGNRIKFYEEDSGKIFSVEKYILNDSGSARVKIEKYMKNGIKSFESILNNNKEVSTKYESCCGGDSLKLKIKMKDKKNELLVFHLGIVESFSMDSIFSTYQDEEELNLTVPCGKAVEGLIFDFKFINLSDTFGVTRGEYTYFKFEPNCDSLSLANLSTSLN